MTIGLVSFLCVAIGCREAESPVIEIAQSEVPVQDVATPSPPADNVAPSVLLFVIDTLRADRLGAYGYEGGHTPNLDALMQESVVFESCYSASNRTTPSFASLLSGMHLPKHGVVGLGYDFRLNDAWETLPERLSAAGYITRAVSASFAFGSAFGLAQGFASFDDEFSKGDEREWRDHTVGRVFRGGEEVTESAMAAIREHESREPLFLLVHYFDPHSPNLGYAGLRQKVATPYDEDVSFTDHEIGRVLAAMEEHFGHGNALVIVTADHGENLNDEDPRFSGHEDVNYNTIRIPFSVRMKGIEPGRIQVPVSIVDLYPTLLALLGRESEVPEGLDGEDLTDLLRGEISQAHAQRQVFFRESYEYGDVGNVGIVDRDWYFYEPANLDKMKPLTESTFEFHHRTREPRLLELAAGPIRAVPSTRNPADMGRLSSIASTWGKQPGPTYPARTHVGLTSSDAEALRALGYLHDTHDESPAASGGGEGSPARP